MPTRTAIDALQRDAAADAIPATDAALLASIACGDRHALATLHHRHAAMLLGMLHRLLGSRADAEDVLQEAFLQIWRKAGEYDPARGRAVHWLATLARSRALDRLGVAAARRRLDASHAASDVVDACGDDPSDAATDAEEARRVRRALAQIPDTQRAVLELAYWNGLSQSEIARRLDAPLGTIKSSARLGLAKLRGLLGDDESSQGLS